MASTLARKLVLEESIIGFAETFTKSMQERSNFVLQNLAKNIAPKMLFDRLNEDYETKLDNAIDHIISEINEIGISNLSETIERISPLYGLNPSDVSSVFESSLEEEKPKNNLNKLEEHLLKQLDNILEENSGNIISFSDATSTYVTPQECNALVEVYSQLSSENKKQMIDRMVTNKNSFNQVLNFSMNTVVNEERGK